MQTLSDYFRSQQVPQQWGLFLRTLADELAESFAHDQIKLHRCFKKIGMRLAQQALPSTGSLQKLSDLASVLNEHWGQSQWGWVVLQEQEEGLYLEHRYSPLGEAFGPQHLSWTTAFLEGFYETCLHVAGAPRHLGLRTVAQSDEGFSIRFELARQLEAEAA